MRTHSGICGCAGTAADPDPDPDPPLLEEEELASSWLLYMSAFLHRVHCNHVAWIIGLLSDRKDPASWINWRSGHWWDRLGRFGGMREGMKREREDWIFVVEKT